ncbi:MAG: bifunctional phosphoglucose/phosphomannose isomerase [Candidatus Omnitrophica bacterium ADurb.Bin292]|nr:MAG: bifunctional phosphoglucose/phosphomannose isomerase [Candidatus Omnitrophica bacterium ADurb.Bin292]HPW76311.1 bifunctional phosphoglucose/phosphomannose isomerase [Candidatus Omnitrophota bacterium]HQB11936.1 bifunctional phosphoglucose/phosphomannose isomerase [Candidatus Omnitrophota bacterium]
MEIYLKDLSNQIKKAQSIASGVKLPGTFVKRPAKVLFCGMGGSAISGDILGTIAQSRSRIHWTVNRTARLPQWVDSKTIVILSSYSGNTHEVESIFQQAVARKAHFLLVASGGRLAEEAFRRKIPFLRLPQGYPPRFAIGYGTFALLFLFIRHRWFSVTAQEIREVVRLTARYPRDRAKTLAKRLFQKNIVVYGGGLMQPVALRWRTQFAENAKTLVSCEALPEMFHHEVEGWIFPRFKVNRSVAIFLADKNEPGWLGKKKKVAMRAIRKHGAEVIEIKASGSGVLGRIFSMVMLGDWTSCELANLYKIDPMAICVIDQIKKAVRSV